MKSLRIGCVKYLNARPLIRGWPGEVVLDHPAALCTQLARGDLDVALVSSFEFLRNPVYRIVDLVSISSDGPVHSVVVVHRGEIAQIQEIELDPAAETSVNLLRCLLAERELSPRLVRNIDFQSVRPAGLKPAECQTAENIAAGNTGRRPAFHGARLFIGDQAIRFRRKHEREFQFWDLGKEWQRVVQLPFVYALWLVRPEVASANTIADQLRALRDENLAKIDTLIAEEKDFDHEFCGRYYREHLHFNFGKEEKRGLTEFRKRCVELRLLRGDGLGFETWDMELAYRCL